MRFADNSKYFFLYAKEQEGITAVWLSREEKIVSQLRNLNIYSEKANSLKGWWLTMRAEIVITDCHPLGVNYFLTGGAKVVNLWHAIMLKKVMYDSHRTKKDNFVYASKGFKRFIYFLYSPERFFFGNYFLSPGKLWDPLFMSASRLAEDRIIKADYPRNAIWLEDNPLHSVGADELNLTRAVSLKEKGSKIIFYMPTFRDGTQNPLRDSGIDFDKLENFLETNDAYLFIKFHHEEKRNHEFKRIYFVDTSTDPYPIMKKTDVLITDYSSVFFDFLFADRPTIFFAYDLDKYKSEMREMYFEYDDITPGEKVMTFDELLVALEKTLAGSDGYQKQREEIKEKVWDKDRIDAGRQELVNQISALNR